MSGVISSSEAYKRYFSDFKKRIAAMEQLLTSFDWSSVTPENREKQRKELEFIIEQLIVMKSDLQKQMDKMMILVSHQHLALVKDGASPILIVRG